MLSTEPAPELHIDPLGRQPQLVPVLTAWHVPEFDPGGDTDRWLEAHAREARMSGCPCAWVAFVDEAPVGSVSLIEHNMDTRRELTPWLAALFVLPSHRGRGIGTALGATMRGGGLGNGSDPLVPLHVTSETFLCSPRLEHVRGGHVRRKASYHHGSRNALTGTRTPRVTQRAKAAPILDTRHIRQRHVHWHKRCR
jgi:GNAT superfamily N-acetyltransferase